MSPEQELMTALQDVFCNSSREMSERDALEAALAVAEGWRMRLDELEDEDDQ